MLSGSWVNSETSTSKWVVTKSWVRCFDEHLSDVRQDIRVQSQFRLFDADDPWRAGMAEHSQKANIAQSAVRHSCGRNRVFESFFMEKDLDGTAVNFGR